MRRHNTMIILPQIFLLILLPTISAQSQDLQFDLVGGKCSGNDTISSNSTYHSNILTIFEPFKTFSSVNLFFNDSSGVGEDLVNGFYLCRPDLPLSSCKACVNTTINTLNQFCSDQKRAIVWYDACMIQYTNNSVSPSNGNATDPWDFLYSSFNVSQLDVFPTLMNTTLQTSISDAVSPNNPQRFFATAKANFTAFEELNVMVFCRPDITAEDCESCLRTALDRISTCCGFLRSSNVILQPYCQLRYDTAPFFFSPDSTSPSSLASTSAPVPVPAPAPATKA